MMTRSGDEVHIRTSGFPVDIDTDFGEPWHLPHMGHSPNDDTEAARIAGARMAGAGMQEASEPMPLAVSRKTPQHRWSRAADIAVAALFAGCLIGWALWKLA